METATQPIDVVLPCLNEAGALPWLLTRMPAGYRPIVADNGSTDGSARIAAGHGATVVDVPQRGFGAACHAGLLAATSDLVCIMDADGSFDPQDLEIVSSPVRNGTVDLMLGRRAPQALSAWPAHGTRGTRSCSALATRSASSRCTTRSPRAATSSGSPR
ncbi:MAG: glycosyltransferase family 2 protein, partial [Trebonia sp.]